MFDIEAFLTSKDVEVERLSVPPPINLNLANWTGIDLNLGLKPEINSNRRLEKKLNRG